MTSPLFAVVSTTEVEARDRRDYPLEVALVTSSTPDDVGVLLTCEALGVDLRLSATAARKLAAALELAATVVEG